MRAYTFWAQMQYQRGEFTVLAKTLAEAEDKIMEMGAIRFFFMRSQKAA